VITFAIRLRSDYDISRMPASNSMRRKINMSTFCRSHIAVESNADRNFDHFRGSRVRHGIVVWWSNRSVI